MAPPTHRHKSLVWNHFKQDTEGDKTITCLICKFTFRFGTTTKQLALHLETKHSSNKVILTHRGCENPLVSKLVSQSDALQQSHTSPEMLFFIHFVKTQFFFYIFVFKIHSLQIYSYMDIPFTNCCFLFKMLNINIFPSKNCHCKTRKNNHKAI